MRDACLPCRFCVRAVALAVLLTMARFATASPALTNPASYRFDVWTTDNGLPHNHIMGLLQARDGYLWVTTEYGLVRFDGIRFRLFTTANTPGLASARFSYHTLREDRHGVLWMGTEDGGVVRLQDGRFTSFDTRDGLPGSNVFRIDEDDSGTIWIFTTSGLAIWQDGHIRAARDPDGSLAAHLISPKNVGMDARFCGLWRAGGFGWQRFAFGQWRDVPMPPGLRDPAKLSIRSIVEDTQGRIWYDVLDRPGDYFCVERDGRLRTFTGVPPECHVLFQDRHGRLWMGDHQGRTSLWHDGEVTPLAGFETPYVFQPIEDRDGSIWIGTLTAGLYHVREQPVTVYRQPGGPELNALNFALQDRQGRVWTSGGGLVRLTLAGPTGLPRFDRFYADERARETWDGTNQVYAIYEDTDGSIWVGLRGHIARMAQDHLVIQPALSAAVQHPVRAMHRDRQGDLWLGATGLYRDHAGHLTRYAGEQGLPSEIVTALHEDHVGRLWIGTSAGLARLAADRILPITGTAGMYIYAIHEDADGRLWIGTRDHGLICLVPPAAPAPHAAIPILAQVTTAQGLRTNRVVQILEDDLGFLWISSHLGLQRVRTRDIEDLAMGRVSSVTSTRFGKADGFLNPDCAFRGQPAGFVARDGTLWFPTEDGLASIDPRTVTAESDPPPVAIEEALIDRRPVGMGEEIRIESDQENLEIAYTAPSLHKSDQIRFRYRLDGVDHDWVEAGTRRAANYSHIPPGRYTFTVVAANSDGPWNSNGARLGVTVLPAFHQTWWFRTLATGAIVGLIVTAWQYRAAQWQRLERARQAFAHQLIASQEHERKRIAGELHDSLGQHLVVINNLALLSLQKQAGDGDERRQPIEQISAEASRALSEVKAISYNLRPYQLDRLGLTKAVEAVIKTAATASPITFTAEIAAIDGLLPQESEINFYRIVQESVNNVVRHSAASEAHVSLDVRDRELCLIVRDNGRGFTSSAAAAPAAGQGGFGLAGMAERAQLLGGTMAVQSAPQRGTTITVTIAIARGAHA